MRMRHDTLFLLSADASPEHGFLSRHAGVRPELRPQLPGRSRAQKRFTRTQTVPRSAPRSDWPCHSQSSIYSSSISTGRASPRSGRPSRLGIGATRCSIGAGNECESSLRSTPTSGGHPLDAYTAMVRRQEELRPALTPEAVPGGHAILSPVAETSAAPRRSL